MRIPMGMKLKDPGMRLISRGTLQTIHDVFGNGVTRGLAASRKARPIVEIDQDWAAALRQDRIASIDLHADYCRRMGRNCP